MQVRLDRGSGVPLYQQVAQQLRERIESGELQPGDRIANEQLLASQLELSRPTVARAINQLVRLGLLVRRRGVGTEVASTVLHQRTGLTSLFEDLTRNRRNPSTRVLTIERHLADAGAAAQLRLPPNTPLVHLRRLRLAGSTPVAVMDNWLPGSLADLTEAELTGAGLYAVLRQRGRGPETAKQRIGAKAASTVEAQLLRVRRGTPLMTMDSIGYDRDGIPVECGTHVYRADVYSIEVIVKADAD